MHQMSPTSLKLTFAQLNKGKSLDLMECLKMVYPALITTSNS